MTMRWLGRLLAGICLAANGVVVALLLFSAYSSHIHPQTHPVWACAGLAFPVFLSLNVLFGLFWLLVCRRYALLPLLGLLCCWGSIRTYSPLHLFPDKAPEGAVKFLTYNTQAFGEKTSHTKEKPNEILEYLQESGADIICLQEYIWGNRLKKKDIDYALRKYPYKHYYALAGGLNGLGCYSRYPILSATPLPYKSNRNGSIAYRIKVKEDTLLVVNNHLESYKLSEANLSTPTRELVKKLAEGSAIRASQAEAVAKVVAKHPNGKVIVCGDFNDSPISYTHRVIGEGLEDAFAASGCGPGFSYVQHRLFFRIDHILVGKGLEAYQCTVDDTMKGSDHYPVWCLIGNK